MATTEATRDSKGRFKANGETLDAQFAHVFRVKDGKVVAFEEYADTLQTARVMGREAAAPHPARAPLAGGANGAKVTPR